MRHIMEDKMKKTIVIILLLLMSLNFVYAESLDESYIDLIFDKFASYDDDIKAQRSDELMVFMESGGRLEILYTVIVTTKQDAMADYNITTEDVRKNIDALKTWSKLDRYALVEAGVAGDRAVVDALNVKYSESSGGTVTPPTPVVPTTPPTPPTPGVSPTSGEDEQPLKPAGSLKVTLELKGFINEEKPRLPEKIGVTFEDTKNHWSNSHVLFLAERGIISGHSEISFAPEDSIKKSEIVALIMKLIVTDVAKVPEYTGEVPDLEYGKWYDDAMKNAYTLDLIEPNYLGYLDPNHHSTREEVVDILIRAIRALEIDIDPALKEYKGDFKDFNKVKTELQESMASAINLGFISGMGDGTIAPGEDITRGQIAAVVKKVYLYILDQVNEEVVNEE